MTATAIDRHHDFSVRPAGRPEAILGCQLARAAVLHVLRHPGVPPKLFLAGPAGSGKTSLVKTGVELVACERPDVIRPCGSCPGCLALRDKHGKESPGAIFDLRHYEAKRRIDYVAINCRNSTVADIEDRINCIRYRHHALRIIHLEEAASLSQERRDERLTDFMDDPDFATCRWVATAVTDEQLDEQFRRRWTVKVATTPPSADDLADELAARCRDLGIQVEDPRVWTLMAERSWGIVGLATSVLAMALVNDPPCLTVEMVTDYPFPRRDPWLRDFFAR